MIAATNHADLLDPAVWRRFEELVEFDVPQQDAARVFLSSVLENVLPNANEWSDVLSIALQRQSYSEIERKITGARRTAALNGKDVGEHLSTLLKVDDHSKAERIDLAVKLVASKLLSQRRAHELTGVARDTIRQRLNDQKTTKME